MTQAPILLFTHNRPEHTKRTVSALVANSNAEKSDLIIYSDAAKNPSDETKIKEVRDFLESIEGFHTKQIHHRPRNYGLANSIISGVSQAIEAHDRVIVLEDDMVTSPYFLDYMNEGLERFAKDSRVASIHGYLYPVKDDLPEFFFLRGADCWGWATWRRAWKVFNPDGKYLLEELRRRGLISEFNFNDSYPFSEMLQKQIAGENDSWAIRWYASTFLENKLTLYPGRSLVHNIGNDGSGTHCEGSSKHDSALSQTAIQMDEVTVQVCEEAKHVFSDYFKSIDGGVWQRIRQALRGGRR